MSRFSIRKRWYSLSATSIVAASHVVVACGGEALMLEESGESQNELRTTQIMGEARANFREAAFVGDLDADGYADFVLLANGPGAGPEGIGTAYLFYGRPEYPEHLEASDADLVLHGAGDSVAALGDVDADGYPDFAFTAYCEDSACVDTNGLHLLYGGEERYQGEFEASEVGLWWTLEPNHARYYRVSAAGDLNGDGHADLLLDATVDVTERDPAHNGFLLLGRAERDEQMPNGIDFDATFVAGEGEVELEGLTSPGDLDGDGYSEIILSTVDLRFPDEEQPSMWLFYGSEELAFTSFDPSVADASFAWSEDAGSYGSWFNDRAGGLGDLDGDGYADFAVRVSESEIEEAHGERILHTTEVIHVIAGTSQRFEGEHDLSVASWSLATPSTTLSQFGSGDIDADGRLDLVIGDSMNSQKALHGGALLASRAAGYEPPGVRRLSQEDVLLYGRERSSGAHDWLGVRISTGDADRDGFDDILASAPGDFFNDDDGGRVVLVFGESLD